MSLNQPVQESEARKVHTPLTRMFLALFISVNLGIFSGCDPSQSAPSKKSPAKESTSVESESDSDSDSESDLAQSSTEVPVTSADTDSSESDAVGETKTQTNRKNDEQSAATTVPDTTGIPDAATETANPIRVLAWNIESNGANPEVIAKQLTEMERYDIYGFSEVRETGFPAIKKALGEKYYYTYSISGFDDRLAYAINTDRFEVRDQYEFNSYKGHIINPGNYRAPFVMDLKDKQTNSSFLVVLNHLARGKAEIRQEQALAIRMWAKAESKPIIALGDYNFDYVFATDKGNPSMDIFLEDGTFNWIRPVPMIDSNYYDEDKDGVDDYIDSLLDFVFAAGDAKDWDMECQVVVREGDFPDDQQTSDHRPIQLIIKP